MPVSPTMAASSLRLINLPSIAAGATNAGAVVVGVGGGVPGLSTRADLSVTETANAAGVPADVIAVAEADGPLADDAAAAIETLVSMLADR